MDLGPSEDDIRNNKLYTQAQGELDKMTKAIAEFKSRGGTPPYLQPLCGQLKATFKAIDKIGKNWPDFSELGDLRNQPMEVAKAIVAKFPDNNTVKNYDIKTAVEDPSHRFI